MENLLSNLFQEYGFNVVVLGILLYITVSMRLNFKHIDKQFESIDKRFEEIKSEIKDIREEIKDIREELKDTREELKADIADLRADLAFHEGVESAYGAKLPYFKRRKKQQKETVAVE